MLNFYYICNQKAMGKISDHIKRVLEKNDLHFDTRQNEEDSLTTFIFGIKGDNIHMRVNIVADEDGERYMIRCYPDWYVPKDRRADILSLLNSMNVSRWLTRVGLDPEDGELAYVWTVLCKGSILSEETTENYIYATINMADDETTEVLKAVYGGGYPATSDKESGEGMLPWTPRSDN